MPQIVFDEQTHTYTVGGVRYPSVTEILAPMHDKAAINPAILATAAERGKMIHETLEFIDYGEDVDIHPEIAPYVIAYHRFLTDYRPRWELIETPLYSPFEGGYCGTVDRCGQIDGLAAVVDIKTIQTPTQEDYVSLSAQTAAYAYAINPDEDIKRYGLFLRKDRTYRLVDCDELDEKRSTPGMLVFQMCFNFYQFRKGVIESGKRKRKE